MATRKPKPRARPKLKLAGDLVDEARAAITARCRMTDANASATLVLFALSRALGRDDAAALGRLSSTAREVLDQLGEPAKETGVDELTHRRFIVQTMSDMLTHQRDALARRDPRRPPPLPALYTAQALSRMLGSGPLRALYESKRTPEHDGDAAVIAAAWADRIGRDGCIRVDDDPASLARKLLAQALVALGVPRKAALDGLARKASGKKPGPARTRR